MKNTSVILGETCLVKYQLSRSGIKQDATNIFDDMLVNLEGVRKIVENDFSDLMNTQLIERVNYLYYPEYAIRHNKHINKKYTLNYEGLFSWDVCCFFHFDIETPEAYASLARKTERTKAIFESEDAVTLFYYYRPHPKYDIPKLKQKLDEFLLFLEDKYKKSFKAVLITQEQCDDRDVEINGEGSKLIHGHFKTRDSWIGIDDNWDGHSSNDLFDYFFTRINNYV